MNYIPEPVTNSDFLYVAYMQKLIAEQHKTNALLKQLIAANSQQIQEEIKEDTENEPISNSTTRRKRT